MRPGPRLIGTFKNGTRSSVARQSAPGAQYGGRNANHLGSQSRTTVKTRGTIASPKRARAQAAVTVVVAGCLPTKDLLSEIKNLNLSGCQNFIKSVEDRLPCGT